MKTKIALILMALACAFAAVPAYAEQYTPEQIREWRAAANRGEAWAQYNLGLCYKFGNGVEKDLREAVRWFRRAAEQGDAQAQFNLGACYANGEGVEEDLFEAWHWFSLAADQGYSNAKEALASELFSDRSTFGVDAYIPSGKRRRGDVFVCVVANEDYSDSGADKVPHAVNDGKVFAEYARKTLGVPARNVKVVTNATVGKMMAAEDWLAEAVRVYPDAEVVFYYAGHGVPVIENGKITRKCLLPTDISPGRAERSAVDVDELLARLSRLGAKQVTVFLDACFSGTLDKGGRGVRMKAGPTEARGNMAVFAAASGDETALPLDAERHGLFTYCLLKKLQDTKGEVTWGELGEHLKRRVPQLAHEHGLSGTQTPTVSTSGGFDLDRRLTE
ncbi:MAG: caspase family protein [Candidatus Spyradosoma sp.]